MILCIQMSDSSSKENNVALYKWSMDNGLQFQPSKCKILFFGFNDINFPLGDQLLPSIEQIWVSSRPTILAGINILTLKPVNVLKYST